MTMNHSALENLERRTCLIVGNGPSCNECEMQRIPANSFVVRTNNFFFESNYNFGKIVHLLQIGGDRWIFPYYAKTLSAMLIKNVYKVNSWSTHQPHIAKKGKKIIKSQHVPFAGNNHEIGAEVEKLSKKYRKQPTAGIYAILNAHALGASEIILAGFDLYTKPQRYSFTMRGYSKKRAMANNGPGYNEMFHSRELDLEIIQYLNQLKKLKLYRCSNSVDQLNFLSLSPIRKNYLQPQQKTHKLNDWETYSGPFHISLAFAGSHLNQLSKRIIKNLKVIIAE